MMSAGGTGRTLVNHRIEAIDPTAMFDDRNDEGVSFFVLPEVGTVVDRYRSKTLPALVETPDVAE